MLTNKVMNYSQYQYAFRITLKKWFNVIKYFHTMITINLRSAIFSAIQNLK